MGSTHLFALLAYTKCHAFCFGSKANQTRNLDNRSLARSVRDFRSLFNRHVDQAVLLELRLRIEVSNKEAGLLVSLCDFCHQLDV